MGLIIFTLCSSNILDSQIVFHRERTLTETLTQKNIKMFVYCKNIHNLREKSTKPVKLKK